jgi:hypothetical protein
LLAINLLILCPNTGQPYQPVGWELPTAQSYTEQ